ncbi:hypothetical protein AAZX31_01G189300 [Glycine max]
MTMSTISIKAFMIILPCSSFPEPPPPNKSPSSPTPSILLKGSVCSPSSPPDSSFSPIQIHSVHMHVNITSIKYKNKIKSIFLHTYINQTT